MKKNEQPLISVILCFYNEERFIKEAIDSVLSQDHTNWELLLVDDGSSDRSVAIAKEYESDFPERIFYLHHPGYVNKGLSASRNAGIRQARGEYVAFLDADDVWLPGKLKDQLQIFKSHPSVTVVLEASNYWKSWMNFTDSDVVIPVGAKEGIYEPPKLMATLYPLGKGAAPCPSGIMVKKDVLRRCCFEDSFRGIFQMYEDQAFLCKVYLKETVYVSSACNNLYRQRPASLVSSVHDSGKYHMVRKYYLNWFRNYLDHQPVGFENVLKLLDKAEMPYKRPIVHKLTVDLPRYSRDVVARVLVRMGILSYRKTW